MQPRSVAQPSSKPRRPYQKVRLRAVAGNARVCNQESPSHTNRTETSKDTRGQRMPLTLNPPPPTPIEPVTEILHGVSVTDPYRWLEDQNSPRTRKWLEEQTGYARAYLDAIPSRERIRKRVSEFLSVAPVAEPWNVGDRYFFLKRHKDKEQPVIVM